MSVLAGGQQGYCSTSKSSYVKSGPDIDLLMIGKTGNGKSALGNSLLQQNAFESKPSASSVTKEVTYEVTEFNGRQIKVVDSPGVGDTDWSDDKTTKFVSDALADAISINPRGYNAFLLVVRFGGRFTKEDHETIVFLKKVFGESFVKRYCILVMTFGDQFEDQVDISFKDWLNEQSGVLIDLLHECNERIILFDNRTRDEEKKQRQLIVLFEMVDALILQNSRYTNEQFELARSVRETYILTSNKAIIFEDTMNESNIILQIFKRVQEQVKDDNDTSLLEDLLARANRLYEDVFKKDNKTGVLSDILLHIESLKISISNEMLLCQRISEYKEMIKRESVETHLKLYEEMNYKMGRVVDEGRRLSEYKEEKIKRDISSLRESEAQWMEEKRKYHDEFQKILEQTNRLEEEHKQLKKKKDRNILAAIKHKVAKTFQHKTKVKKEDAASTSDAEELY